ncbi:MAG: HD domain-containing protein [Gemmatimonadota bacterium]|nr:MAG: HD domain-containing protein [Gemmatimonadota bacterium]
MTEIQKIQPEPDNFDTAADARRTVEERFARRIVMSVPDKRNKRLQKLMEIVNDDDDLYGLWLASNVTAIQRLGMTDHGPVHVKIVMNIAVRMLRLLLDRDVVPSVVVDWKLSSDDAEVVVALGALLHDVGMSIQRADHEDYSLFIAQEKLRDILPRIYDDRVANVIRSEVLHAIIAHRSGGKPLTLEAGLVRIADALDMAKGRSRIPFEAGSDSIHSISAAAIDSISIDEGGERPICITVQMTNSAGVFQLDQLFREKLKGSGLEPHVELRATLKGDAEERLFKEFKI